MARPLLLLSGLLGPLLAGGLVVAALHGWQDQGPVYTVAQVRVLLAHHPRVWTDRTLLLRGVAAVVGCWVETADALALCAPPRMVLADAGPTPAVAPLPLVWVGPSPLLAIVRRMPLLAGFAPVPQAIQWNVVTTYRVQLRAVSDELCGAATCYEALLLDAVP